MVKGDSKAKCLLTMNNHEDQGVAFGALHKLLMYADVYYNGL